MTVINSINNFLSTLGWSIIQVVNRMGFIVILLGKTFVKLHYIPKRRNDILKQMYIAGFKSLAVCGIVAFFTGMILALQSGLQLIQFQQQHMVGTLVINTMTKEMGPFMTALIITASVGAAMASEVGTMKVTEQVDALEIMSISPVQYLVMPRVVSLAVMLPAVTVFTTILGVIGGAIIAKYQLSLTYDTYFKMVYESIWLKDIYVGLFKSFVFGICIAGISCGNGLKAENGVLGVGAAIRTSVVSSFLMILISGYFITSMFYGGAL